MALSMTGFGRGQYSSTLMAIRIELRSVNHRFLEISLRLPRALNQFEERMRRMIAGRLSRGKVDATVHFEATANGTSSVRVDYGLVQGYHDALLELAHRFKLPARPRLEHFLQLPDLFIIEPIAITEETLWDGLSQALHAALGELTAMRRTEGEKLAADLLGRLKRIESLIDAISARAPAVPEAYMAQLQKRLAEILNQPPVDENRLAQEMAIFADRCNITEELVRLRSHLAQFRETLTGDEALGRKSEFIVQEINREINTIGAKANDLSIAQAVIEIKAELEKTREQIQNLE